MSIEKNIGVEEVKNLLKDIYKNYTVRNSVNDQVHQDDLFNKLTNNDYRKTKFSRSSTVCNGGGFHFFRFIHHLINNIYFASYYSASFN